MKSSLNDFALPGPMTDAGDYQSYLDDTPCTVADLCRLLQGVMIHVFWADQYGVQLTDERREEVQLRTTTARLKRILELDVQPLAEVRPPDRRMVGNCRDYAVMLTAVTLCPTITKTIGFVNTGMKQPNDGYWLMPS